MNLPSILTTVLLVTSSAAGLVFADEMGIPVPYGRTTGDHYEDDCAAEGGHDHDDHGEGAGDDEGSDDGSDEESEESDDEEAESDETSDDESDSESDSESSSSGDEESESEETSDDESDSESDSESSSSGDEESESEETGEDSESESETQTTADDAEDGEDAESDESDSEESESEEAEDAEESDCPEAEDESEENETTVEEEPVEAAAEEETTPPAPDCAEVTIDDSGDGLLGEDRHWSWLVSPTAKQLAVYFDGGYGLPGLGGGPDVVLTDGSGRVVASGDSGDGYGGISVEMSGPMTPGLWTLSYSSNGVLSSYWVNINVDC